MSVPAFLLLVALGGQDADAPPPTASPERRPYAQGSVFISSYPRGLANHRVRPPLGGKGVGLAASAGAFVTPNVAIEGEFVLGGTVSDPQVFSYWDRTDYIANARDLLVHANLRFKPAGGKMPFEMIIGGGLAFSRVRLLDQVRTRFVGPNQTEQQLIDDETFVDTGLCINGGVDAAFSVGPRAAIVPGFRLRWVSRPDQGRARYVGFAPESFVGGVTVRFGLRP